MDFKADLRDVRFQLFDCLPMDELLASGGFGDWDRESLGMALDEAYKVARESLGPGNEEGDRTGARLDEGRVTLPASFHDAYRTVAENGWIGCTNSPQYSGLGMPHAVGTAAADLFAGANLSLTLVFLLTRGVGELIERHGTDEMRELFCERLYTGRWAGTMCLTEPHAGSDVGASTARAEPLDDGRYRVSGEKIYITFGEHDLAENIVHAVLARLPDAPAGTRGLSLFVIPKTRVEADGALGASNDVHCASIEHKLGIHGSPTCSILFGAEGGCEGYLLGEPHQGIRVMFELMNAARIEVGIQSASVAAAAHQAALAYARERIQGRHWAAARDAAPVAIVEHPDVRRMLFTSDAFVQAMRALLLKTAYHLDRSHVDEGDAAQRHAAYVDVLTPICKAWCSDWAFRVTEWCLQVYGGYGYTKDYPAEQYLRDVKICSIYEGTNGIQALDLVGRKLRRQGDAVGELLAAAARSARELGDDPTLGASAKLLGGSVAVLGRVLEETPGSDDGPLRLMLNAVPILDMFGHVLGAHLLLEQGRIARDRLREILVSKGVEEGDAEAAAALVARDADAAFLHNKTLAAIHFAHRALPLVEAAAVAIEAGETAPIDAAL